jgi:hypothetical protein
MAITLKDFQNFYDVATHDSRSYDRWSKAQTGNFNAIQQLAKEADFSATMVATTDNSDGTAVDLTAQGVTFPVDTIREIRLKSWCATDNDRYFYESVEKVLGGTTPVLLGQQIVSGWGHETTNVKTYGKAHFKATTTTGTTVTVVYASAGITLSAFTSAAADLGLPKNRLCLLKGAHVADVVSTTASNADIIGVITHNGTGTGTAAVKLLDVSATTDAALATLANAVTIELAFEIWPPFTHRLVMATNSVTVKCAGTDAVISDDKLRHRVEVYVSKLEYIDFEPN